MSSDRTVRSEDAYADQLRKLIPTEVSAALIAINAIVPPDPANLIWVLIFAGIFAFACILYLRLAQKVEGWWQIIFTSFIVYPVWAATIIVSRFEQLAINKLTFLPACFMIAVTLIAPFVVRAKEE